MSGRLLSEHGQWNLEPMLPSQYATLMEVIHKNDGPTQDQVPKSRMKKSSYLLAHQKFSKTDTDSKTEWLVRLAAEND